MKKLLTLALVAAVLPLALTAGAEEVGPARCISVQIDWQNGSPLAVGYAHDLTNEGDITYAVVGNSVWFQWIGNSEPTSFELPPNTIDASACTDRSVFLSGPIEGQDADWTTLDDEITAEEPVLEVSEEVLPAPAEPQPDPGPAQTSAPEPATVLSVRIPTEFVPE